MVVVNPTPLPLKSHYWHKDLIQPIMVIKKEFFNVNSREIATNVFHENFHYSSSDILKTREFYEQILVDIGFIKIKHNLDKFSNLELTYSTCHIYKILTVKQ